MSRRLLTVKACHQCMHYLLPAPAGPRGQCRLVNKEHNDRHSIPGFCPLPAAAVRAIEPPELVKVRVRVERDATRRAAGIINGLTMQAPGWLVVGSAEPQLVLEVEMREAEFASETIDRFVRAHEPSIPPLDGECLTPLHKELAPLMAARMLADYRLKYALEQARKIPDEGQVS